MPVLVSFLIQAVFLMIPIFKYKLALIVKSTLVGQHSFLSFLWAQLYVGPLFLKGAEIDAKSIVTNV
jgi:hypothetical protein